MTRKQTLTLYAVLFWVGASNYVFLEFLFRGYSFIAMAVLGGISLIFIDSLNDYISMSLDLFIQGLIGGAFITVAEIIVGNLGLALTGIRMWDYRNLPLSACGGFICPQFTLLWVLISIVCAFVGDSLRYYVFHGNIRPVYRLFGWTFKLPKRECE